MRTAPQTFGVNVRYTNIQTIVSQKKKTKRKGMRNI